MKWNNQQLVQGTCIEKALVVIIVPIVCDPIVMAQQFTVAHSALDGPAVRAGIWHPNMHSLVKQNCILIYWLIPQTDVI
jgi:hypothetical protein